MAVTLAQAAVLSQNELQRGVLEIFVQESVLLDVIPFLGIEGNAYAYNMEATLPGVAFRNVNEDYVESTGTFNPASEALVILGGDADVDRFIVQTRGNLNDQRAAQTRLKVKAMNYKFQDHFFNGDTAVDTKGFDGLKKRLTGNQVVAAATNGLGPIAGGHAFFDALDDMISRVNGSVDVLFANKSIQYKIMSSGRRLGSTEWIDRMFDVGAGEPVRKRTLTYNGIPVLDPGQTAAGVDILPQTETQGTASGITSSIYAVRFGQSEEDFGVTGLENGGVDVRDLGELQQGPRFRTRIEFYCGLAVFGGKAAARLTGVLNA